MAELNKFQRSKDRILEILNYLISIKSKDEKTKTFISDLQKSLRLLDKKMDEFRKKNLTNNQTSSIQSYTFTPADLKK
jgi:hypothetical protein